jgi:copper homeostasis protein
MYQLEVIAFNIASCITAQTAGANRIELCDNPGEGGTTPSAGMISRARDVTSLLLYPIIRPRGGDFLYSDDEFRIMLHDVKLCNAIGTDGVVVGMLNADGSIDKERVKKLVDAAYPLGVTFHRAFDRVKDPVQSLEDVIECNWLSGRTTGSSSCRDRDFVLPTWKRLRRKPVPGSSILRRGSPCQQPWNISMKV